MKKQITLLTLTVLFTGTYLCGSETTPVETAKVDTAVISPEVPAVVPANAVVTPDATNATNATVATAPAKTSRIPTIAQAKAWCTNHKLIVGGTAAVVGFAILWKTCPAFRAFFGVEDEQEQEKLVVF